MIAGSLGSLYYLVPSKALVPSPALSKSSGRGNHRSAILCVSRAATDAASRGLVPYGSQWVVPYIENQNGNHFFLGSQKGTNSEAASVVNFRLIKINKSFVWFPIEGTRITLK